jgi:hypothetical protein
MSPHSLCQTRTDKELYRSIYCNMPALDRSYASSILHIYTTRIIVPDNQPCRITNCRSKRGQTLLILTR